MVKKIPVLKLSSAERVWLQEVYDITNQNKKPDYRYIWSKLYRKIPNSFSPVSMNAELIDSAGEEIKVLGVIALEKNTSVLKKINKVLLSIKEILIERPHEEQVYTEELTKRTKISASEISVLLNLIRDFGNFWGGLSFEDNSTLIKSIHLGRNSGVFYRYIKFNNIEELILVSLNQKSKDKKWTAAKVSPLSKRISEGSKGSYLSVNPVFKGRLTKVNTRLCFVLMPFKEEWSDRVYRDIVRKNIDAIGLQCIRADDLTGQNIVEDIWIGINQASLVIADMTNNNPNVMYELGIAHTVGKPTILITQELASIPFDFRHLRHIQYRENLEAAKRFKKEFQRHLYAIYNEHYPSLKLKK